jgi:hypothetical protein
LMTYKSVIDNIDKFQTEILKESVEGFNKEDYARMLKSEIRQTLYHSIETVFELIFALATLTDGRYDDENILEKLTNSNWRKNSTTIKEIAESNTGLDFLDTKINANGFVIPLAHYIFYYGVLPDNTSIPKGYLEMIEPSIDAIKYGLKILAQEFEERMEYNSYKHGIRLIPVLKEFQIFDTTTQKSLITFDLSDSMTFMHSETDNTIDSIEFITIVFDTNRDIGISLFCAHLISNMILLRKAGFRNGPTDENFPILFFGKDELKEVNKVGVPVQKFKFKSERDLQKNVL